jgi:hypothetical protein
MRAVAGAIVILAAAICFSAGLLSRDYGGAGLMAAIVLFIIGTMYLFVGEGPKSRDPS